MKYRKRPVVIEAVQWTGSNQTEVEDFMRHQRYHWDSIHPTARLIIHTLEGDMTANVMDWIIRGVASELYPCKDEIFRATYEPEDAAAAEALDR